MTDDVPAVIKLLGPVVVLLPHGRPARLGARPLGLLTLLTLQAPRVVSAERLVDDMWTAPRPPTARNAVQVHVSALRSILGPGAVRTESPGYRLDPRRITSDVSEFERIRRLATAEPDPVLRSALLAEALAMWQGEPLANLEGPAFAAAARSLEEQRQHVLDERFDADLEAGRASSLVAELTDLVRVTPMRERRRRQLALALYWSGRQGEALDTLQQFRRELDSQRGLAPSAELRELEAAFRRQDPGLVAPAPERAATTSGHAVVPEPAEDVPPETATVPLSTSPLMGREAELERVLEVVDDPEVRLVTLLGTGGIGKTRMAQAVAERRPGAVWVSLETVTDPSELLQVIASDLGVTGDPDGDARGALKSRLTGRLLVLDNMEHLLAGAPLVHGLLGAVPRLTVLATSRVALQVVGEVEFQLPPLAGGEAGAGVELFLARARAAGASLPDDPQTRAELATLVARLDGLPLAIELAAARARLLPPASLLARLTATGDLPPVRGPRPERHRSLTATMDWSYGLLSPASQRVLARLSVFSGGFSLDAAEQLCAPLGVDVLGEVTALVEASLVRADDAADRFHLPETVHSYAAARLLEDPDGAHVDEQHAAWMTGLAERLQVEAESTDDPGPVLDLLVREVGNLDAALGHLHRSGDGQRFAGLLVTTRLYWLTRASLPHLSHWLRRVANVSVPPPTLMALACFAGYAGYYHHALALAREWVDRGLAAASDAGQPGAFLQVDLMAIRSRIEADSGELERAERTARQALDQATAMAYGFGRQAALVALGWVSERQGDAVTAVVHYTDGVAEIDRLGMVALRAWPLLSRAHALLEVGRLAEAEADVARAREDARRCGDRRGLLLASLTRGLLHLARRRTTEAERTLRGAADQASQLGDRRLEGRALIGLAAASAQRGDLDEARQLLARGLAHEPPTARAHPLERVLRAELDQLDGSARAHGDLDHSGSGA